VPALLVGQPEVSERAQQHLLYERALFFGEADLAFCQASSHCFRREVCAAVTLGRFDLGEATDVLPHLLWPTARVDPSGFADQGVVQAALVVDRRLDLPSVPFGTCSGLRHEFLQRFTWVNVGCDESRALTSARTAARRRWGRRHHSLRHTVAPRAA